MEIRIKDLTKIFPGNPKKGIPDTHAVDKLNITIPDGQLVGLLGPSGCGKSTTLYMVSGLLEPTDGEIWFGDEDVTDLEPEKRGIGLVFQNYALYPHMTVYKNVAFPLTNLRLEEPVLGPDGKQRVDVDGKPEYKKRKLTKDEIDKIVRETARIVQIEPYLERKPSQLSGGQQQRVAIARALVKKPKVLLLDEPLSNLDARLRLQTREEIRHIQQSTGITTIFVTHDQEEALAMSDQIMIINDGTIQQSGTPVDIYDEPLNHFVADFIGESNIVPGVMKADYLVTIDGQDFECVDAGMRPNERVEVVIRPEDLDITTVDQGKLTVTVDTQLFRGVDYQITAHDQRDHEWRINSIHKTTVGAKVGLAFDPEDIHVMRYNESEEDFDARLDSYEEDD